jgi:hypothetical protein
MYFNSINLPYEIYPKGDTPNPVQKKEYTAYCSSNVCRNYTEKFVGTVKKVPLRTDFCPDCGNALFWTKAGERYHLK